MFTMRIPGSEKFDETTGKFIPVDELVVEFEHSLVSLSKWEQKYKRPFLGDEKLTPEETLYYIRLMVLGGVDPDLVMSRIRTQDVESLIEYMGDSYSATWFTSTEAPKRGGEQITSELIYFWMTAYHIPFEAQYWNLNNLFTLIRVANHKNQPEKKLSQQERAQQIRETNAARRAKYNTNG